jgi:hypothetical protein
MSEALTTLLVDAQLSSLGMRFGLLFVLINLDDM